jgi:hypothetical protein
MADIGIKKGFLERTSDAFANLGTSRSSIESVDALSPIRNYFVELVLYLPNTLMLFGPIVDAVNQEFRYSFLFLIGIVSVLLHGFLSRFADIFESVRNFRSALTTTSAVGCGIPGLEWAESVIAPQTLVLVNSILGYLIIDFASNTGKTQQGLGWLWAALFLPYMYVMSNCGCFDKYYFSSFFGGWGKYITILLGVGLGFAYGGSAYAIVKSKYPDRLPSTGFAETFVSGNMIKLSKKSDVNDIAKSATCPAIQPSDLEEDEYLVGELYKNGKPVTP